MATIFWNIYVYANKNSYGHNDIKKIVNKNKLNKSYLTSWRRLWLKRGRSLVSYLSLNFALFFHSIWIILLFFSYLFPRFFDNRYMHFLFIYFVFSIVFFVYYFSLCEIRLYFFLILDLELGTIYKLYQLYLCPSM